MKRKVLVVEDEENIRELVKFNLENEGYQVYTAPNGEKGLELLDKGIELIILDLMLPVMDGYTFCRTIREDDDYPDLPIIMLTAKGDEVDRVIGLELGADDYVSKPFSPRELVARVKAIFRRVGREEEKKTSSVYQRGSLYIDLDSYEVKVEGDEVELTPREFELLSYLVQNEGRVLTRELLLEKIWGYEYAGDTRTVDVHVRRLRKKIGQEKIVTVRGVGYKFVSTE